MIRTINKNATSLRFIVCALATFFFLGYAIAMNSERFSTNKAKENSFAAVLVDHPLIGKSDNIVFCRDDGQALHEIYLCGTSDDRLLTTSLSNVNQIVWSKLQPGSCADSKDGCANRAGNCNWNELSTNTQYTVSEAGEYNIFVVYNNGTNKKFYFNVFSNGLNPSIVVSNIDCDGLGSIMINNVPANYEFSIN
jgi:hypothetical protein